MKIYIALLSCCLILASTWVAAEEKSARVVYRYKNAQGVTVMDSSIPPQFVSKGYEVLSLGGKVLKVVPPAMTAEAQERENQARLAREEQARSDQELRRSYSNVSEIDAAKTRNLQSLQGNIDILQANLASARSKLRASEARAASLERIGRQAPDELVNNINLLGQEETSIQEQIKQRQLEYQQASDKFDADRQRFLELNQPANR